MGYHVILKQTDTDIECRYVENLNELAELEINENSIIYQGDAHWTPVVVKNSKQFENFAYDWHRAGIKAQELFKKQARESGYILEELNQDQESFKAYTDIKEEYLEIKRGDFLIRNIGNIEVDVKCRKIFKNQFAFNKDHLIRHTNMMKFTKTPIVIAIYHRHNKTGEIDPESLRMIDILHMQIVINEMGLKPTKQRNGKEEYEVYNIPLTRTMKNFDLIELLKDR